MLEKIEISNFQSHKATKIDLVPTVNTLQGNSDCGKSAVMRAINWLLFNPAGDYFVSDWAKKGKSIVAPCSVTIEANGHVVTRKRDKDFNGYILDGEVFEATRNSVPPKVAEALCLGEVNVQRQLDPPFLLSMSAGDVSRYINSLVNLTEIDRWAVAVNGRSRRLQQQFEAAEKMEVESRKEFESYGYLDGLEEVSERAKELEDKLLNVGAAHAALNDDVLAYMAELEKINNLPNVDKLFVLLAGIEEKILKFNVLNEESFTLVEQISSHEMEAGVIKVTPNIEQAVAALSRAQEIKIEKERAEDKLVSLSIDINRRLSISVPVVSEKLFEIVTMLERWKSIEFNISESCRSLLNEIEKYELMNCEAARAEEELKPALAALNEMVCPMCGRSGVHTHKE